MFAAAGIGLMIK